MFSKLPNQSESDEPIGNNPSYLCSLFNELTSKKCGLGVNASAGQTVFKLPNCGCGEELWSLDYEERE